MFKVETAMKMLIVKVSSLAEYTLKGISSGSNHSLAVDQWGSTFRHYFLHNLLF